MDETLGKKDIAGDFLACFDSLGQEAAALNGKPKNTDKKPALYGNVTKLAQPRVIAECRIAAAGGKSVTREMSSGGSLEYTRGKSAPPEPGYKNRQRARHDRRAQEQPVLFRRWRREDGRHILHPRRRPCLEQPRGGASPRRLPGDKQALSRTGIRQYAEDYPDSGKTPCFTEWP